ncbi:hypothetical protein C2845_PM13G08890 [Panicum miliaceum]|uniref:Rad21/Rec8-like protein N-terminal domain-containing protein n=1 Tax=Panicum miliaceum TaxID=4540 RepID=A0A3L6RJY5_PANMI|nr:hypothetical protein C2845_PM13G08890 [Panicum miliaceum]
MFYSHTILARKSPLGTVWIAAHLERKIKQPQIDGIDIPTYAESIMYPEVPIVLRLSGHLLLGLARIYSWKVNYLFLDCNRMINTSDNHQKTPDQITLAEGGEYVMIDLDEDDRIEPSASYLSPYMGPEPFEPETFPRFDDGFGASNTLSDKIPLEPPGNMPENPNIENPSDGAHDPPEIMREAPREGPDHFTDSVFGNDDPMVVDQDSSPFVQNKVITPPSMDGTSSAGQPLAGIYVPLQTPNTCDLIDDVRPLNSDNQSPELCLEPSPPPPQAQDNKRKKEMMFDYEIQLDSDYMKEQIDGPADKLLCKRRKIPQTALDTWKFSRTGRKDSSFLLEPLMQGKLDAPSERQLTPKSHENEDTLPEGDLTPKSPGNSDEQPEQQPTPKSSGGAVNDDYDDQPEIPGLISTPGGISNADTGTTGLGSMSARTRAVALFFKDHVPSTPSDEQPGKFSLTRILEGSNKKVLIII